MKMCQVNSFQHLKISHRIHIHQIPVVAAAVLLNLGQQEVRLITFLFSFQQFSESTPIMSIEQTDEDEKQSDASCQLSI